MYPWETKLYHAILAVALLICLLVVVFGLVLVYAQKKRAAQAVAGLQHGINTLENERARIAADLHDDLGASLSALKLQLQAIDINNEKQGLLLERSGRYIDETVKKLKAIAFNLMPRLLEQEGLCIALNELVEMLINRDTVKVQFYCDVNPLNAGQSLHIYRIIQEIITNSCRHAKATRIYIDVRAAKKYITLRITDNGIGFNKAVAGYGLGLQNIRSRVNLLNARLDLKTKPGAGVDYLIKIPLK